MKKKIMGICLVLLWILFSAVPVYAAEDEWMDRPPQLSAVTDDADILSDWEEAELQAMADEIAAQYSFGVYIITVWDYRNFNKTDVFDAAFDIYKTYSLGEGNGKNGVLLFLSMQDRDYSLLTHGEHGNYAFNDEGRPLMSEFFLDDFYEDDWYSGFSDYLTWCADYLENAQNGTPYSNAHPPVDEAARTAGILIRIAIILLVPLIIAAIYVAALMAQMKSVAKATRASAYISTEPVLTQQIDNFMYSTETRRKIESSGGSGGSRNSRSGGASGTSGKF